jgi:outer membrane protein assembly factor BamB
MRIIALTLLGCLFGLPVASAKITNPVTLEQVVAGQPLIFLATVAEFLPEKPGMILKPTEVLRGEFPYDRIPVNLAGDTEAVKEKQPEKMLERLGKDAKILIFALQRGKTYTAFAFTNGTWFGLTGTVETQDDKPVTRWKFTHAEPYFRKTFAGSTEELLAVIRGGLKGEKLPAYNEKMEPGYGPPLKVEEKKSHLDSGSGNTLFGVIQLPFLGIIAALAALFPAVFGGMALMMKRWVAALSVASIVSMLSAIYMYFPGWIRWTGIRNLSQMWLVCAVIASLGALWSVRRYRRATAEKRGDDFQPQRIDRIGLLVLMAAIAAGLGIARGFGETLVVTPWFELLLLLVPVTFCAAYVWMRKTVPASLSAETVGLWAATAGLVGATIFTMNPPIEQAVAIAGSGGGWKLKPDPVWVFESKVPGEVMAYPCVQGDRVYVAVHHRAGLTQYGQVYALDAATGNVVWEFGEEEALKEIFCSPVFADGKLYFGEGYHTNRDSRMFCVDATTGKQVWQFPTTSHTESTPAIADGIVVFGAGDDGLYGLDALTGKKHWQYTGTAGLHVDCNPVIRDGRVFAGSGVSQKSPHKQIFALDLKTGNEIWFEKVESSAWGGPIAVGQSVYFPIGNGTFTEDRDPKTGQVLCREAATGKPVWQKSLPNSLVGKLAQHQYTIFAGCRDGNIYALDRLTGEILWEQSLGGPILASPVVSVSKSFRTEALYVLNGTGTMAALSPHNGGAYWTESFQARVQRGFVRTISTPAVHFATDGTASRRLYVGLGFGDTPASSPTARLYCFEETADK